MSSNRGAYATKAYHPREKPSPSGEGWTAHDASSRRARRRPLILDGAFDHCEGRATARARGVTWGPKRMEDLRLSNRMKSAKGTIENPSKNVTAKRGLHRRLADQGLRMLRELVAYKLAWSGGEFEAVDPRYTSQRCHPCGHVATENRAREVCMCRVWSSGPCRCKRGQKHTRHSGGSTSR